MTSLRQRVLNELQRCNYSAETTRWYIHAIKQFADFFGKSHQRLDALVNPITGKRGQDLVTRLVLVDQFQRKYKTEKIRFRWVGGHLPPSGTVEQQ